MVEQSPAGQGCHLQILGGKALQAEGKANALCQGPGLGVSFGECAHGVMGSRAGKESVLCGGTRRHFSEDGARLAGWTFTRQPPVLPPVHGLSLNHGLSPEHGLPTCRPLLSYARTCSSDPHASTFQFPLSLQGLSFLEAEPVASLQVPWHFVHASGALSMVTPGDLCLCQSLPPARVPHEGEPSLRYFLVSSTLPSVGHALGSLRHIWSQLESNLFCCQPSL